MRSLPVLLKLKPEDLTKEEQAYLDKYLKAKQYRHTTAFIRHNPVMPKEPDVQWTYTHQLPLYP